MFGKVVGVSKMPRTVSSSEAQNNFGAIVLWTEENQDDVVVERHGKPTAVIVSYDVYRSLTALRDRESKLDALKELQELRQEVQRVNPAITAEEAYRAAGFSEQVLQDTLRSDEDLRQGLE